MRWLPEGERTPCYDDPYPFDILQDLTCGGEYAWAIREAAAMCGGCPFRAQCHTENAGEPWVDPVARVLRGERVRTVRRGGRERE